MNLIIMHFLIAITLCVCGVEGYSQNTSKFAKIKLKMLEADSVLIISHEDSNGLYEDDKGKSFPAPPLFLNGKLNHSILHEKLVLQKKSVLKISKIIARPCEKFLEQMAGCFEPHHSIVMIKEGKYSYIEICFQCARVRASEDINFSEENLDKKKWNDLRSFFKQNNFKYELY